MQKFYVWTIGCQMNVADSQKLESAFDQIGLTKASSADEADVVVLNSCVVRQSAEDKVIGMMTSLKPQKLQNPEKIFALMGCMVGPKTDKLEKSYPYIDVFLRPQEYDPLLKLIGERKSIDVEGCIGTLTVSPDVTAFVPIIHGCDKFCTFCIIPYRRGREVSRKLDEIILESELLVNRGVKEITLLGQNVDSYGHDLKQDIDLSDLLYAMNDIKGLSRVRFLTSHPNDMSENIIDAVANLEKVCENINLPMQAGSNEVLSNMHRGYTNEEYRALTYKIRNMVPNITLTTDVIVGFCGETDNQFRETINLVSDTKFDKIHSAAYSFRENTIASRTMIDDVPKSEKMARLNELDSLQETILRDLNSELVGETFEVLVEGKKRGRWFGRNRNDKLIYFDNDAECKGKMVQVNVTKSTPWSLSGDLVRSHEESIII